jgi:hypothetical protein
MKKYTITNFDNLKAVKALNRKIQVMPKSVFTLDRKKAENKMSCRKWTNED